MRRRFKFPNSKFQIPNLNKSGQSLIEVLIAFTVSVVIGMALVSAGLATQRASISARNKSQATKLAQEYLEEIRLIRDEQGFLYIQGKIALGNTCWRLTPDSTQPSGYLFGYIAWNSATCNPNVPITTGNIDEKVTNSNTDFYRRIILTTVVANVSAKVTAKVIWKEGTNTRSVSEETTLTQWCKGSVTGTPVAGVCP